MTRDDFPSFQRGLQQTAAAYGKPVAMDVLNTYFGDLEAYPIGSVLAALDKARQTGKFFPRVATLRELCATDSRLSVTTDVPPWVNHDQGVYFCQDCADTGFTRGLVCDGDGRCHIQGCGREGHQNLPHDYTRFCSCRGTNPVLRRQREILAQRTAKVDA